MPRNRTVKDIMTTDMLVLREEDSLAHVEDQMRAHHVHHFPVVDGTKLVGMVSHRDVLKLSGSALNRDVVHTHSNEALEEGIFVASVMAQVPVRVPPDMPVLDAAKLLTINRFGCLPVTEADGTLLGLVTENDCVRLLIDILESEAPS